jgi:polysaccharide export outer membrane protein
MTQKLSQTIRLSQPLKTERGKTARGVSEQERFLVKFVTIATVLLLTASAFHAVGQRSAVSATASANSAPTLQKRHARYKLRQGDSLEIGFQYSPEFNQTVAVEPDGYVTLREVGSFYVEGQTVPQLTDTIMAAYAKTLSDPVVTVTLKDFVKPHFIASGQVSKPGKYDWTEDMTVTEAIAIAGGFTEKSKHSQVVLFRPLEGGGYQTKLLDVKKMLASRNLSEDVQLKPGDMLYVPQNAISKIRPFLPTSGVSAYLGPGVF